jgi:regulatory protein
MAEARKSRGRDKGKEPRALDAAALDNAALHYLGRFASSSANLRRILMRKVARRATQEGDAAEGARLVEALIARYLQAGLLDDRAYATQAAASLARRGSSRFSIGGRLAQKGVATELVKETIAGLDEAGSSEIAAACAFVRRRRLGPYRTAPASAEQQRKDLASLARAGFSFEVARRVLAAPDSAALEALARGEDVSA